MISVKMFVPRRHRKVILLPVLNITSILNIKNNNFTVEKVQVHGLQVICKLLDKGPRLQLARL